MIAALDIEQEQEQEQAQEEHAGEEEGNRSMAVRTFAPTSF